MAESRWAHSSSFRSLSLRLAARSGFFEQWILKSAHAHDVEKEHKTETHKSVVSVLLRSMKLATALAPSLPMQLRAKLAL
jgi:hypothetical protein